MGTRTPDLYRVKSEVKPLQPFSCLAFPFLHTQKTALKQAIFGDELVTSFVWIGNENPHFVQIGFRHSPGLRLGLHLRRDSRRGVERKSFRLSFQIATIRPEFVFSFP